jgi:hypothetical protein
MGRGQEGGRRARVSSKQGVGGARQGVVPSANMAAPCPHRATRGPRSLPRCVTQSQHLGVRQRMVSARRWRADDPYRRPTSRSGMHAARRIEGAPPTGARTRACALVTREITQVSEFESGARHRNYTKSVGIMLLCGESGAQGAVQGIKRYRSRVKNGGHIARYDRESIHPTSPTGGAYAAPVSELTSRRNAPKLRQIAMSSLTSQTKSNWNQVERRRDSSCSHLGCRNHTRCH